MKSRVLAITLTAIGIFLASCLSLGDGDDLIPDKLVSPNFLVETSKGWGSGPGIENGDTTFVWTACHVVAKCQQTATVVDQKTGQQRLEVLYEDVNVVQEEMQNGRKVGEHKYLAQIIRFSNGTMGGDDLALLRVYKKNLLKTGISFLDDKFIPKQGAKLWHVGSHNGAPGANSVMEGTFSVAGKVHSYGKNESLSMKVYDQVTIPALHGCSGGGVYLKTNSKCIGLLTEGIDGQTESINFIVPSRRIREFAKRANCLWAVDPKIPVPSDDEIFSTPISDRPIAVPNHWKKPAAPPKPAPTQLTNGWFGLLPPPFGSLFIR